MLLAMIVLRYLRLPLEDELKMAQRTHLEDIAVKSEHPC